MMTVIQNSVWSVVSSWAINF